MIHHASGEASRARDRANVPAWRGADALCDRARRCAGQNRSRLGFGLIRGQEVESPVAHAQRPDEALKAEVPQMVGRSVPRKARQCREPAYVDAGVVSEQSEDASASGKLGHAGGEPTRRNTRAPAVRAAWTRTSRFNGYARSCPRSECV